MEVLNQLSNAKESIIRNFESINVILFTPTNEQALIDLKNELSVIEELIKNHVEKGAENNDTAKRYLKEYNSLVARNKENKKKKAKACELALFINNLKRCDYIPIEFNEILFQCS